MPDPPPPAPAAPQPPQLPASRQVMGAADLSRALARIAHELLEARGPHELLLLGIPRRGVPLAHRLGAVLVRLDPGLADVDPAALVGSIDVTMHRDDLRRHPARALWPTRLPPGGVDDKVVVLVDDVLSTGRTIRAALDALADLGRPRAVRLAVLVDRGRRELPICADHVGKNLPTSPGERVRVLLAETDGSDGVVIDAQSDAGFDAGFDAGPDGGPA